jgi:hypothetical protein
LVGIRFNSKSLEGNCCLSLNDNCKANKLGKSMACDVKLSIIKDRINYEFANAYYSNPKKEEKLKILSNIDTIFLICQESLTRRLKCKPKSKEFKITSKQIKVLKAKSKLPPRTDIPKLIANSFEYMKPNERRQHTNNILRAICVELNWDVTKFV